MEMTNETYWILDSRRNLPLWKQGREWLRKVIYVFTFARISCHSCGNRNL